MACVPPTTSHHAKRIVQVGAFKRLADRPELVGAKAMLDELLLPHQPVAPVTGPVKLSIEFTWPWRKSEPKRNLALGRMRHTSKPDCDNAAKTLTDRLAALRFIEHDQGVAELRVTKWWGAEPGIVVRIEPLVEQTPRDRQVVYTGDVREDVRSRQAGSE
jgi:Holliday junction resolvase RusA-like endonuclease